GLRVQTFKVGPDFLDPTYLALASQRPCYNLDGWMTGRDYVLRLFARAAAGADLAVIEGVMGLFDGADPCTNAGSTAEIALWLDAPVLLAVNAHGAARSLAAMVRGFCEFDSSLRIAGVIANQAGSARHARWLEDSLAAAGLPQLLGAIPRGAFPALPSRHLGLVSADRQSLSGEVLNSLADALERNVSLDAVMQFAASAPPCTAGVPPAEPQAGGTPAVHSAETRLKLGVAQDRAFHFYYPDNLEALQAQGCELVRFSPLADAQLPAGLKALYLGGGYPEEYAAELAANKTMLAGIRAFAASGRTVYAECGGLMYLAEGLQTVAGERHALAGVLPLWTRMLPRRKALGYVEVTLTQDALWGARGSTLRGHEFHYSELLGPAALDGLWRTVYSVQSRRAPQPAAEGFQRGRVLASYVHAHFASRPEAVKSFTANCEAAP
ncbi:MAG: cobyrinate a,c-diamide synthase, partial [Planctomycetota bacterium]